MLSKCLAGCVALVSALMSSAAAAQVFTNQAEFTQRLRGDAWNLKHSTGVCQGNAAFEFGDHNWLIDVYSPSGNVLTTPWGVGPFERLEPIRFYAQGRSMYAFGAQFTVNTVNCTPAAGLPVRIELNNGQTLEFSNGGAYQFLGYISEIPFTVVGVSSSSGGYVQVYDVIIGQPTIVHDADACSGAREICTGRSTWNNLLSTTDTLPLNLSPYTLGGFDVWMTWTASFTGKAIIHTESMPAFLVVYDGSAGCPTTDTPYVTQSCVFGLPAQVEFQAELGKKYYIRAGGQLLPPFFFGEKGSVPIVVRQAPACIADVNGDGLLNIFDFLAFQTAFGNGC